MKKRGLMLSLLVGAAFAFVPSNVWAKEFTVEAGESIQEVIAAETTEAGDVIILLEGDYTGDIQLTKALTLKGAGEENTTIKGQIEVSADTTIQDLTISAKGLHGAGVKVVATSKVTISDAVIQYDGYTEGNYGTSDYFRGIWLVTDVSDGSELVLQNSKIYAKYGIHLRSANNKVTITNSEITGYTALDISNGPAPEYGGNTTTLAENNKVSIENSTLTGVTAATGSNSAYGTIVIGGQKNLELLIDNSTVTNKIVEGQENQEDLIRFGHGYLASTGVEIAFTNSKLINTDADNNSAIVNFMTEDNTLGGNIIIVEDTTEIVSANDNGIEIYGDAHLLTYSTVEGDVSIAVPNNFEITEDMLVVDEVEGYTFDGWYVDEAYTTKFVAGTKITEDTTVYAKFTKIETTTTDTTIENVKTGDINLALIAILVASAGIGFVITGKKIAERL